MQTAPSEHLIFRSQISREFAFPLGYELLQRAFGDLPQWPLFEFWFKARPVYRASEFARTLAAADPYPIVCVRHGNRRHENSYPCFSIHVMPVARAFKSFAREGFFASSLDAFRQFIVSAPANPNYQDLRATFFDPVTRVCTVRDSMR